MASENIFIMYSDDDEKKVNKWQQEMQLYW
jgi:hypothetical protein